MNREKLEARLWDMGLDADRVYLILVLADEYAAHRVEQDARGPARRQRRGTRGHGDAQREWQETQA
jgi:hypothetical protein